MKSLNLPQTKFQSKFILCFTILLAIIAVGVAFHHINVKKHAAKNLVVQPQTVVVTGKRMTQQEKLDYDTASMPIATIEIVGHRLTASN